VAPNTLNLNAPTRHTPSRSHDDDHPRSEAELEVDALAEELAAEGDPRRRAELIERIVHDTLPLADSIAMRYRGRGIETDDLLQVARTALVKAVGRYRPGAGPGFAAFASPTIAGEIKRWFRDQGWAVRPPRRIQELRAGLVVEEERMRHALSRNPHDAELATALGVSVDDVDEARSCSAGYHAVSLDVPTASGSALSDVLLVSAGPAGAIEVRDALRRSLTSPTERQRLVVHLRFVEELTQSEIGARIGVSQMQVSRILRGVLDRLRADVLADDVVTDHARSNTASRNGVRAA
jgi:RNA polymerase sigma-B factor